jgi:glycosyltransferase involved in cell wall biosynthesis
MPLRVALMTLNAAGVSGVPRYTTALARALQEVSHEFPALEFVLVTTPAGAGVVGASNLPVRIVRPFGLELSRGSLRLIAEQVSIPAVQSDLVHFFDVYAPLFSPRRPFTATFHDASICYPSLAHLGVSQRAYKRMLYPWALSRAAAIVAVSRFAMQEAVERFHVDPRKVTVIHSGPGLAPRFDPPDGSNGRRPYLLFVGNLTMSKNLPFLVRAYERAEVAADLVLAGRPASDAGAIYDAIARSPRRDRIRILTTPDDAEVDRLYRQALGLLHPARYEGFAFTPLEAMSRGCPVVASDIPAIREVSGQGALLVPLDDEHAWVDAIRRLAGEERLRDELRARGRETVAGYSWAESARQLCRVFLQVGAGSTAAEPWSASSAKSS